WTLITRSTTLRSVPTSSVGEHTSMRWRRSARNRPSTASRGCARLLRRATYPRQFGGELCIVHLLAHHGRERLAEQPIGVRRGHLLDDGKWHAFELCDFFCHPGHER